MSEMDAPTETVWRPWAGKWSLFRAWRLLTTAFSFALFGAAGLVMALIFFPVMNLVVRDPSRRETIAQGSVHRIWRVYIEIMRALGVLTYSVTGADLLANARGTVVVANHPSLLDVVFLMAFMRKTRAVVKEGVWNNPFMSGVVRSANYIPNLNDPDQLLSGCVDALQSGYNLCIFPEGSRTPEGQKRRYQRGFAYAAMNAHAPVLVVSIDVSPPTLRKGEPWYAIPVRRPHWNIRVERRIDVAAAYGMDRSVKSVRRLSKDVEAILEKEVPA